MSIVKTAVEGGGQRSEGRRVVPRGCVGEAGRGGSTVARGQ